MSDEQKPGDPADKAADKAADGAFGGVQSHRAGYGEDKLARLIGWLRAHPTATLASGEGALLLGEIDRWHAAILDSMDNYTDARAEIGRLQGEYDIVVSMLSNQIPLLNQLLEEKDGLRAEIDRLRRILAALREPSKATLHEMTETWIATPWGANHWQAALRAAVAAAEKEVGE